MIARRALAWHEWFVKRIGSVDFDASIAVRDEISTIMIRCSDAARRRPSAQLIASPRISPIFRRGGIISAANTPWPSISLLRTKTSNFWYAWRTTTGSAANRGIGAQSRPVAGPRVATAGRSTRGAGVQPFLRCSTTTLV